MVTAEVDYQVPSATGRPRGSPMGGGSSEPRATSAVTTSWIQTRRGVGARRYVHPMSNMFREVARTTENPATKLLAEGLTALTEALRELDAKLETVDKQLRAE